ncbi:MAG: radical SAM/SPASM domain-containing protein [Patescibacteria group bacterium]|jgi:MoaA/NifB/PqqE/SkfB family radical SAM enzyme|nr:radical SAM protein [Candidatus Magasanikbacteria bacterium]
MKIIRLENTNFGFSSLRKDEVDKLVEFDSDSGALKVHILQSPQQIPFGLVQSDLIGQLIGQKLDNEVVRIIHNSPVPNAYSAPFKIYLDITLFCSFQCPFCLSGAGSGQRASLPVMLIEKLVIEIQELGVMYVKIGGGDPFLHPDFETIINLLRSAGCFLTISTNSALIKPQIVDLLAKAKVRTSVSIEGMEVVNDRLRGSGHFQKALNVLETLKKGGVNVLLRTTLLRQNLDDIPKLVNLARSREVKIKFSYCRPAGRAVYNQTMLSPQDSSRYLKVLKYLNSPEVLPHILMDEGMMFVQPVEILQKLLRGRMCGAANRSMHIDANGKVSPCIFLVQLFLLGKSTKMEPLEIFGKGKLVINFKLFVRFVSLVNAIVAVVFVKTNVQLVASISGATMINRILTAFMR